MIKKILIGLGIIFLLIQIIRPAKNISGESHNDVMTKYAASGEVKNLLKDACYNCHSNHSDYPWYSNIQPVGWWLNNHIKEGKSKLKFSEFTSRRIAWQNHKFEETIEMVKEKKMPLPSYTWLGLHPEAKITDTEREMITSWAQAMMDTLANQYPADSLIMRRR